MKMGSRAVMWRKALVLVLVIIMVCIFAMPVGAAAVDNPAAASGTSMTVSNQLISITEARSIKVTATFKHPIDAKNLTWTFGNRDFSQWKKWNAAQGDFSGDPFVALAGDPVTAGNTVTATIRFDLPFETDSLTSRRIRVQYPKLLGTYELKVQDKTSGESLSYPMRVNVYDDYHTYGDLKTVLDGIKKSARPDRYVEVSSLGKSADGEREQYFVIIAKSKETVENYLNKQVPLMLNNPAALQQKVKTKEGLSGYKTVIWFNNVHADEAPGPDANLRLAEDFATKDTIRFNLKKAEVSQDFPREKELKVLDVLDDIILVFNITENPYGRDVNRRANINGFDLNRDYTYQTQLESQNFARAFSKWVPLSMIDFHGFYSQFLIEPCTGPHNPNFEFDLLIDGLVGEAYNMGKAGVANTKYLSFDIPYLDYKDGFDDAAPCYTSTYAIIMGSMGHTAEVPELNEDSYLACLYSGYGAVNYVMDHKGKLAYTQLEVFRRGVENIDNKEIDRYLTDSNGLVIGRNRTGNANYFPEYYIIPMDKRNQKNTFEATQTVNMLLANGVKVQMLTKDTTVNRVKYLKGSYIVPMHQARRGFANIVLSKGFDASDWNIMYAEIVNAFPNVRGFDVQEIRVPKAFAGAVADIDKAQPHKTYIADAKAAYVVRNSSNQAPLAVNELLKKGKTVRLITAATDSNRIGDYLVAGADIATIATKYDLDVVKAGTGFEAKILKKAKVYLVKSSLADDAEAKTNQTGFVLAQMGFDMTDSIEKADIIVDNIGGSNADVAVVKAVKSGKPYIAIGGDTLYFVRDSGMMNKFDFVSMRNPDIGQPYEGVLKSTLARNHLITGGYDTEEQLYSASGTWISQYPDQAVVLEKVVDREDLFVSGWWPGYSLLRGKVLGFQYKNIVVFANDLTNKAHPSSQFRLLANAINSYMLK